MISLQLESEVIKAARTRKEQSKARKDRSRIERNTKQHKSKISDVDLNSQMNQLLSNLIQEKREGQTQQEKKNKEDA